MTHIEAETISPDNAELNTIIIAEKENAVKFIQNDPVGVKENYFDGPAYKPYKLASRIVEHTLFHRQIVTLDLNDSKQCLRYDPEKGIYVPDGETWLTSLILPILKNEAGPRRINDTIKLIKIMTLVNAEEFQTPGHVTALLNGVYDWSRGELVEHSPKFCATRRIPVHYDKDAECPRILKYLDEVSPTWSETGRSAVEALLEYAAYFLYPDLPIHRLMILTGDQGTGKGTFTRLISIFLGEENLSGMSLQGLQNYTFNAAKLSGTLGNICSDIGSTALKDVGLLKSLTGGDLIEVPRKYGVDNAKFRYSGKFLFTCNEVPPSWDVSDAWYVRVLLVKFPNQFRGTARDNQNLITELTEPRELSGLFNILVKRLPILLDRGFFDNEPTLEERRLNYLLESDNTSYFTELCLQPEPDAVYPTSTLYDVYCRVCHNEWGVMPKSSDAFGKTLQRVLSYGTSDRVLVDSRQRRSWLGVGIKPEYTQYLNPVNKDTPTPETQDTQTTLDTEETLENALIDFLNRMDGSAEYGQIVEHLTRRGFTVNRGQLAKIARENPRFYPKDAWRMGMKK